MAKSEGENATQLRAEGRNYKSIDKEVERMCEELPVRAYAEQQSAWRTRRKQRVMCNREQSRRVVEHAVQRSHRDARHSRPELNTPHERRAVYAAA